MSGSYEWLASESAPSGYPMKVVAGDFGLADGTSLYVPANKIIQAGWGTPVSTHLVGEDYKALPDKLGITFYSYTEDRFYDGDFVLPHARIAALFAAGHDSPKVGEWVTYERIVAGVAPGGALAVWLQSIDRTVEVFFGQAAETDIDFKHVAGAIETTRERYVEDKLTEILSAAQLQRLRRDGVPLGLWDRYRRRFHWRPLFDGPAPRIIAPIRFFNGEVDFYAYPLQQPDAERPVPSFLEFQLPRAGARPLRYLLHFEQGEIFDAFRRLDAHREPIELVLQTPTAAQPLFSVRLRTRREQIVLGKTDVTFRSAG